MGSIDQQPPPGKTPEKEEEKLPPISVSQAFQALNPCFADGVLPPKEITSPLGINTANICILVQEKIHPQGEVAVKLGFGDFNLESTKAGPHQLQALGGPVFVLQQQDAYMLSGKDLKAWQNQPRSYLFFKAAFIIDGDRIYAPTSKEESIRKAASSTTLERIQFVDFENPDFQNQFAALEERECVRRLCTQFVREKIGIDLFEKLIDQLSGEKGKDILYKLRRTYNRWLNLVVDGFIKSDFKPDLYKGETPWNAEEQVAQFVQRVQGLKAQYKKEHGIEEHGLLETEVEHQLEEQALEEFDPTVTEDLKLACTLRRLEALSLFHRDQIVNFGNRWDRQRKEFDNL